MVDVSRNAVLTLESWRRFVPIVAKMGYDRIFLYAEDTYEVRGEQMFGYMRGRYSIEEQKQLVELCVEHGIELIPCIQTLAHLEQIFRWGVYPNDTHETLMVGHERTYELIENMLRTVAEIYKTKYVHIGMDEAHNLGRGKYLDTFGFESQATIMRKHLDRVKEIAKRNGLTPIIWSDMLFRDWNGGKYYTGKTEVPEEYRKALPDGVIPVYWDYYMKTPKRYENMLYNHAQISDETWFAGGIWTWLGFAPSNKHTVETARPAIEVCRERGVKNVFFTYWGDDGGECSVFSALPALYHVSEMCKGNFDTERIKAGFEKMFGIGYDDFILLDEPNDVGFDREALEFPVSSAGKHLLYSDALLGFLDFTVSEGSNEQYKIIAERLLPFARRDFEYAYIFKTIAILADILSHKAELGVKLRAAYKRSDKAEMKRLSECELGEIIRLLLEFISAYREQWMRENKYIGIEVHEARLGGLLERVKSVKERVDSYISGRIDRMEELECDVIPFGNYKAGKALFYNRYYRIFSPNISFY